jgi:hypothetical protein
MLFIEWMEMSRTQDGAWLELEDLFQKCWNEAVRTSRETAEETFMAALQDERDSDNAFERMLGALDELEV